MKKIIYILCLFTNMALYGQTSVVLKTTQSKGGTITACNSISLLPGFSFQAGASNNMTLKVDPSSCDPYAGSNASLTKNLTYIRTKTFTSENESLYLDNIQYYDAYGFLMQTVQRGITPSAADLVSMSEYDDLGRDLRSWLPAVIPNNNGSYFGEIASLNKSLETKTKSTYGGDNNPYSQTIHEMFASGKVLSMHAAGQDWYDKNKAVKTEYMANTPTGILSCIQYTCGTNTSLNLEKKGNYSANMLYITKLTDEDGNTSYEFKDKQGQVLLTRQIVGSEQYDTYYVYDNLGNQRFVLPPLASEALITNTVNTVWAESNSVLSDYAYIYKYDKRNRCTSKKIPGMDWVYYVYDKGGRLIFAQDGEQRLKSEWTFTIPDALGRIVLTGTCTTANKAVIKAGRFDNQIIKAEFATSGLHKSYDVKVGQTTFSTLSIESPKIIAVNYYDNYTFLGLNGVPNNTNTQYVAESGYGNPYGDHQAANKNKSKGLLTGTLTAQMNADGTIASTYLYSVVYYDNRGRIVQTKSNNHLAGGVEKEYIAYNFTGLPTQKKHVHAATGKTTQTEVYTNLYDHAGRLVQTKHKLNTGADIILAENTYDELGRLKTNKKNNLANLTTTYTYNIRSWTKSISSPLFTQTLYYNEAYGGSKQMYNGNISAMSWKTQGETNTRGYAFTYDPLSRLTAAGYLVNGAAKNNYKSTYSYDKHGNIKTLQRYGMTAASTYGIVDNLTMNYTGNQLTWVNDAAADISYAPSADFKDKKTASTVKEYTYNKNGAMSSDQNKGITEIQYNSLNLPRQMVMNSASVKAKNYYTYSASGVKLKTEQRYDPTLQKSPVGTTTPATDGFTDYKNTDYVGNIIYETTLSAGQTVNKTRILIDGGYIENGAYHFYQTDHLGNNRVVANASGTAIQKTHYYPFGTAFAESTGPEKQPYKYNGKELDDMHGLNLYDYSARYYEGALGRFTSVDPLAEKYYSISPYAYVANNPINAVDLRGDTITTMIDGNKYAWGSVDGKSGFVGSDGALYSGDDKFAKSLTKALNKLQSKDAGRELVNYLAGDAGSVNIVDNNSNSANVTTGKTIKWNDSNQNPGASRPGFIGLGHEMAHIQDKWKGTLDMTPWATVTDASGNSKTIYNAEKQALHIENQIRKEHGKSLRTHYAYDISGNGVNSTQFIQNGASMFHNRGSLQTTTILNGAPIISTVRIPFRY